MSDIINKRWKDILEEHGSIIAFQSLMLGKRDCDLFRSVKEGEKNGFLQYGMKHIGTKQLLKQRENGSQIKIWKRLEILEKEWGDGGGQQIIITNEDDDNPGVEWEKVKVAVIVDFEVATELRKSMRLEYLRVFNAHTEIPEWVGKLVWLRTLIIKTRNDILPLVMTTSLTRLELICYNATQIPKWIGECVNLAELHIYMPNATQERAPRNFTNLTNLRTLRYYTSALLPNEVGAWTQLKKLVINNDVVSLPISAGKWPLKKLRYMGSFHNSPKRIQFLKHRLAEQIAVLCAIWCLQQHKSINKDVSRMIGKLAWSNRVYKKK